MSPKPATPPLSALLTPLPYYGTSVTSNTRRSHATHLPPAPQEARPQDRLPGPQVHPRRPQGPRLPPSQRPQAPDGRLIPGAAALRPMRFRPGQHLRRQSDIRAVREQGSRVDCRAFTVWWRMRPIATGSPAQAAHSGQPRSCVVASTQAVGCAVRRNRAKRRLREIFRQQQGLLPSRCDVLLVARGVVNRWPFPELKQTFAAACGRISSHAAGSEPDV